MSIGDDIWAQSGSTEADRGAAGPRPLLVANPDAAGTALILFPRDPGVMW